MSEKAMAREKYDSNEGWLEDVIMNAWLENDLKRKRELAHRGLAQEAAIAVAAALPPLRAGREAEDQLAKRPVAWRVLTTDGPVHFTDEAAANRLAETRGAIIQGLYVRDGAPLNFPAVQGEGRVPEGRVLALASASIEEKCAAFDEAMARIDSAAPPAPTPEGEWREPMKVALTVLCAARSAINCWHLNMMKDFDAAIYGLRVALEVPAPLVAAPVSHKQGEKL